MTDSELRRMGATVRGVELPDGAPGRWEVVVHDWRPAFASELKCHPMKAARLKKRDAGQVLAACVLGGVTRARRPRRVAFLIANRYGNFPDPDAPLKSGLDALKTAGAIVDDSAEWCDWDKPRFERGALRTTIIIEDLT
jgi:hypothetical protein